MNIHELQTKCKYYSHKHLSDEVFIVVLIVLVGIGGFGLGRLSFFEEKRAPIAIGFADTSTVSETVIGEIGGEYVASKNSTKYHLPWCSGAERISPENKIWFSSKEEAEAAGYTPAANCKGI